METLTLTPEMILVLCILAATIFLFISEIVRVDVVAIIVMVSLPLLGLVFFPEQVARRADDAGETLFIAFDQTFSGFSSNAVISIIAVIILGAALDKTGIMNRVARPIVRIAGGSEARLTAGISSTVGVISGFMQNIGAAALFLPAVTRIAKKTGIPISRLLMPMGFCAILGGTVTMVGSSPLILLNDLMHTSGIDDSWSLFAVTPIGLALIAAGIIYFIIAGRWVLPSNADTTDSIATDSTELAAAYDLPTETFEVELASDSRLVGMDLESTRLRKDYHVSVVALARNQEHIYAPGRATVFGKDDLLALVGRREDVQRAAADFGLIQRTDLEEFAEDLAPSNAGLAEVVVPPRSRLVGRTMRELQFRNTYDVDLVGIARGGETKRSGLSDEPFAAGDALLVHGLHEKIGLLQKDHRNFIVTTPVEVEELREHKAPWAITFFLVAISMILFTDIQLSVALMTGALGTILTGVLTIDEAYDAVDWRTVFLLAGLIPLGIVMEQTQTAAWVAQETLDILGDVEPIVIMTAIAILATAFSLVMSNVGATVLLVPLAIAMAQGAGGAEAGAHPAVFALVVGLATSNSFLIPTHQVNALIMGPGGYRNADYMRAGAGMSIIFLVVLVTMLYFFYQ
ncbi:MAG: SLC13 family permease [Pseudomonadota bacterium]